MKKLKFIMLNLLKFLHFIFIHKNILIVGKVKLNYPVTAIEAL